MTWTGSIEPDVSTDTETPEPSAEATDGSPAAEPAADDGPARDASGRFAPRDNAAKEPAAPGAEGQQVEAQPTPEWKPFAIKVKGQETPLDGVSMTVQDGHVVLATPEQNFNRVRDLMQRGRLYEEGNRISSVARRSSRRRKARRALPRPKRSRRRSSSST
jgi:hypothetical protein